MTEKKYIGAKRLRVEVECVCKTEDGRCSDELQKQCLLYKAENKRRKQYHCRYGKYKYNSLGGKMMCQHEAITEGLV
jgi:hypothetical protein